MHESLSHECLREWLETDLPADDLARLARVDALLRIVAARDRAATRSGSPAASRERLETAGASHEPENDAP